jgi:hypothetical protein
MRVQIAEHSNAEIEGIDQRYLREGYVPVEGPEPVVRADGGLTAEIGPTVARARRRG